MANQKQNDEFQDSVISKNILDEAIGYIKANMQPDDIWDDNNLRVWINDAYDPEAIFPDSKLEEWADNNGFIKENV